MIFLSNFVAVKDERTNNVAKTTDPNTKIIIIQGQCKTKQQKNNIANHEFS